MSQDLEQRIADLEKHVERLQYRESWLLRLLDSRRDPLAYFILENDLSAKQAKGLGDVMASAHRRLQGGSPLEAIEFVKELSPHVPEKEKPGGNVHAYIQRLLTMFAQTGQWPDVVEHFRSDFNVPPPKRLKRR